MIVIMRYTYGVNKLLRYIQTSGVWIIGTADKSTINAFGQHYLNGAGVRPQTPADAPLLAGFNMKSAVAYYYTIHTCMY